MSFDVETFVCAVRGHVTPAAEVAVLELGDAGLGIDVAPTWRISRCLRCDAWLAGPPPVQPPKQRLADLAELDRPRRGRPLRQALIVRLIAIERGIHSVLFTAVAVLAVVVRTHLTAAKGSVQRLLQNLARSEVQSGQTTNNIVSREGAKFLQLRPGTLNVLIVTASLYAVVEGVEAVGLWHERRWAEYLTAVATAGFLPFEVYELAKSVTVLKVLALVVNLAVLVYLVYAKGLFGIGPRAAAMAQTPDLEAERARLSPPF